MWGALVGFVAPFLPDGIRLLRGWIDHRQELQMLRLRLEHGKTMHEWRMEEVSLQLQAADVVSARRAAGAKRQSFGISLMNAAADAEGVIAKWAFNFAFLLFSLLDLFTAAVRPTVTYAIVGRLNYKWGMDF